MIKSLNISRGLFRGIINYILIIILALLFYSSILFNINVKPSPEQVIFELDNPILLALSVCLLVGIIYIISSKGWLDKINSSRLFIALSIWVLISGIIIILSVSGTTPIYDQALIISAAQDFTKGEFDTTSGFSNGGYAAAFRQQIPLIAFLELMFRVFTVVNSLILFQLINLFSLIFTFYFIYKLSNIIFEDKRITNLTLLLSFFCLPPLFFVTFIYGNLISLCLLSASVFYFVKYRKNHNSRNLMVSLSILCLAVLFKQNSILIGLIYSCYMISDFIKIRNAKYLLWITAVFVPFILINSIIVITYQYRSSIKLEPDNQVPSIAWVAMGLQEGNIGPGWYNGFNWPNNGPDFSSRNYYDRSVESIKSSVNNYVANPNYALNFFYSKTVSQWSEPSFGGLWINQRPPSLDSYSLGWSENYYGNDDNILRKITFQIMNVYQSLIYFGALIYFYLHRNKIYNKSLILGLIIMTGFVFHIIWEAKSLYALPYFLFCLPIASAGMIWLTDNLKTKFKLRT